MLVSEAAGAVLTGLGADTVFGVVGSGNFHVTNALIARGARFVAARHEGGAAAWPTAGRGRPARSAWLSVHQGPGLTNALTGITEAAKSRHAAAGAGGGRGRLGGAVQLPDRRGGARRLGRGAGRPAALPGSAAADVIRAYRTAQAQRRTVVLAMPLDVQAAQCDPPVIPPSPPPLSPARPGRRRRPSWPASWPARSGRCSSPGGAPGWRTPGPTWSGSPMRAGRCSPPRPRPRACSAEIPGTST